MSDDIETPAPLASPRFDSTVRSLAKKLETTLINKNLEGGSLDKAIDLFRTEWVAAHPHDPLTTITEGQRRQIENTIARDYYSWIVPTFEQYLQPDPDTFNPMISAFASIEAEFSGSHDGTNIDFASESLARINDIRTDMDHWKGSLEENFVDNFLTPLQTTSLNMGIVAQIVNDQLKCTKIMYVRYRKNVLSLLEKGITAANAANTGDESGTNEMTWLALAGVEVGSIAAVIPGLEILGLVLVVGSTLGQGLLSEYGDESAQIPLAAATAQDVAANISSTLTKIDNNIITQEAKAEKALQTLYSKFHSARETCIKANDPGPLVVPQPAIDSASVTQVSRQLRPDR